ncbi:MAG: hypothetical protein GY696_31235 [Gammaproteobacteria bacterium]|nr:hypothetical protein [Gammaproteobacteria bacterium]
MRRAASSKSFVPLMSQEGPFHWKFVIARKAGTALGLAQQQMPLMPLEAMLQHHLIWE